MAAPTTGIELRPCPFCGGPAEAVDADGDHTVGCANRNDCAVYAVAGPCETAEEAARHWNQRTWDGGEEGANGHR